MGDIEVTDESGVALVRMTKPPANAMDLELLAEGIRVAGELRDADPDAVVITGDGRFFSGGLDLRVMPTLGPDELREGVHGINGLFATWYGFPRPVVAAVNGHAVAGGLIFALCGDLRVGAPVAKLGLTEVAVGVPYPVAALAIAAAEVPRRLVRRLVLGGELISPAEALDAGLLDEIVDDDALVPRSLEVARSLAEHPRRAYEMVKRQLRGDVLDRIAATAERDPLTDAWLADETAGAAAAVLDKDRR